jgi:death-on-curing protein
MQYLTLEDALGINEFVLAQQGQQSLLRDVGSLASAIMRPQMAANHEEADLGRQAALLISGIALARAFVGGNKRTAIMAGEMFVDLNGHILAHKPLEFAEAILALVNHTESLEAATDRLEAWLRAHLQPKPS